MNEDPEEGPGDVPGPEPEQAAGEAATGGYKVSGVGRENHKMMLDHYSQTKCLLVSYDPKPLGFF